MKMHRIVVYVLDFEGYGAGEHTAVISNAVDHVVIRDEDTKTAEIGKWTDDHPINIGVDPWAYFRVAGCSAELYRPQITGLGHEY